MRAVAWRMVQNRAVMEDVLQESYIKAWRNFDRFDGDADQFMAWLHRIVHNTCMDHFRANRKRRGNVSLDERIDGEAPSVSVADRIVNRNQIRRGLQALRPEQAAALALVDDEGYSFEQASQILDVPAERLPVAFREPERPCAENSASKERPDHEQSHPR